MKVTVLACALAVLALVLVAYVRVGWWRMETACASDLHGGHRWKSVEYGWSWDPTGFQCTYDDGSKRTSLWL
jgi:hypothetical protein